MCVLAPGMQHLCQHRSSCLVPWPELFCLTHSRSPAPSMELHLLTASQCSQTLRLPLDGIHKSQPTILLRVEEKSRKRETGRKEAGRKASHCLGTAQVSQLLANTLVLPPDSCREVEHHRRSARSVLRLPAWGILLSACLCCPGLYQTLRTATASD